MKHQAFISHDSRDRHTAAQICRGMEKLGLRCWIAPRDLKPGEDYASGIVEAIESSRAFVLVYSALAAGSDMVLRELNLAAEARIPIIPVRIEDVPISASIRFFIGTSHRLNAFEGDLADHIPAIVEVIVEKTDGDTLNKPDGESIDDAVAQLRGRLLAGPSGRELKRLFYETEALLERHPGAVELRLLHDDLKQAVAHESVHQKLMRVRKPRVQITYEIETYGAAREVELPFVIGVLADLSGEGGSALPPLRDRKFIEIDRDNFDEVLRKIAPRVFIRADADPDVADSDILDVELPFESMADFEPGSVARRIPHIARLLEKRAQLKSASDLAAMDENLSERLSRVLHQPDFIRLEGAWRGLHRLVHDSETSAQLRIRFLNLSWRELVRDLAAAPEAGRSGLSYHLYEAEFGMLGGEPFAAIIGDYYLDPTADVATVSVLAEICARAQLPFIAAAAPAFFGLDSYSELNTIGELREAGNGSDRYGWHAFRSSESARFVGLCMPRVLARPPYSRDRETSSDFPFDETITDHEHYCWTNSAYVFASRLTDAFARDGWAVAIRGVEGGGLVEGLPVTAAGTASEDGTGLPTETAISDRREAELCDLGLIPLCSLRNTGSAAFFAAQSAYLAASGSATGTSGSGRSLASIPLLMATSRFMHYLMVISRDRVGGYSEAADIERQLNRWIHGYVAPASDDPDPAQKARYPLREARIQVEEIAGAPGRKRAIAFLLPHHQIEPLEISIRSVVELPHLLA